MMDNQMKHRYENDTTIHTLVDAMVGMLLKNEVTSHDLARCAVFAAERHAQMNRSPITIVLKEPVVPADPCRPHKGTSPVCVRGTRGCGVMHQELLNG